MQKIIFIYDDLLTKKARELIRIKAKFICYAHTKGCLNWFNDSRHKRLFLSEHSRSVVYGALFVINNFDENSLQLFSYYGSSIPYTDKIMQEDFFYLKNITATPISFKSLEDIQHYNYNKFSEISCCAFFGNKKNKLIKKSLNNRRYYGLHGQPVDAMNFIQLVKENSERKGEKYELVRH